MQIKGVANFTKALFAPKRMKDAAGNDNGDPKYSFSVILAPNDPQIAVIAAEVNKAAQDTFPNGFPAKGDKCFMSYDEKFKGKDYYNPKFSGFWVFSCSAQEKDKPAVVNESLQPVMDPAQVYGGCVVWLNAGIGGYTKGTGGVGGWLNGVMLTSEEPPYGRLDNKPSVEQMFANLPTSHQTHLAAGQPHVAANGVTITAPGTIAPPPVMAPPPAKPTLLMKPGEAPYQDYINAGWTDDLLVAHGKATKTSFV